MRLKQVKKYKNLKNYHDFVWNGGGRVFVLHMANLDSIPSTQYRLL